jgi:hypothetical protein
MYQMNTKVPNGNKISQNVHNLFPKALKYINISPSKAIQNLTKLGFLVRKETIWQPWFEPREGIMFLGKTYQ